MLLSRHSRNVCHMCGEELTLALCNDVRMYKRTFKDGMVPTTVTTRHYRICDKCAELVMYAVDAMMEHSGGEGR